MRKIFRYQFFLLLHLVVTTATAQELRPRIAGMERDSAYMALLDREHHLSRELDSLQEALLKTRTRFREEPEMRDQITTTLLALEERLLSVGSEKQHYSEQLKALEEEWSLKNLKETLPVKAAKDEEQKPDYQKMPKNRFLIANACFRGELPEEEYARLVEVQNDERNAAHVIELYAENYAHLLEMQQRYLQTTEQGEADSLFNHMEQLSAENNELNDSLKGLWGPIFDHKSYAYAYLLDRLGKDLLLEQQIERLSEAQREADALQGEYASDALVDYFIEKRALTTCEMELAAAFDLFPARDSLQHEADYLSSVDYRLPRIVSERRYLLDYAPVEFPAKVSYTTYKVPACKIHERGTIYRIRLLSSKYRQQANIFRGVEPLYLLQQEGRYIYFTGGFSTLAEARVACELLRQKGFKQPTVVRWVDGHEEEVPEDEGSRIRLEISGTDRLSERVIGFIREATPEPEISRSGSTFHVGGFSEMSVAEELARKIRLAESALTVQVKTEE